MMDRVIHHEAADGRDARHREELLVALLQRPRRQQLRVGRLARAARARPRPSRRTPRAARRATPAPSDARRRRACRGRATDASSVAEHQKGMLARWPASWPSVIDLSWGFQANSCLGHAVEQPPRGRHLVVELGEQRVGDSHAEIPKSTSKTVRRRRPGDRLRLRHGTSLSDVVGLDLHGRQQLLAADRQLDDVGARVRRRSADGERHAAAAARPPRPPPPPPPRRGRRGPAFGPRFHCTRFSPASFVPSISRTTRPVDVADRDLHVAGRRGLQLVADRRAALRVLAAEVLVAPSSPYRLLDVVHPRRGRPHVEEVRVGRR